ncbi:MAG: hypothetical protein ACK4K9_01470 [Bacteroidia bacterium]
MKQFSVLILSLFWVEHKKSELPITNAKVIEFVEANIGKKVDRGECWDLANKALQHAGAKWTFPTTFGKPLNYLKEPMLPGDIVQFEQAKFEHKTDSEIIRWSKLVHTAIIYKVKDKTLVQIAEQNNNGVKLVQINNIDFKWLVSGKIYVYRPQLP